MSGPGRPTLCKREHARRARERRAHDPIHPEFADAVQQGLDVADATAVESLFTRVTVG
jgi:hypothetical protein